MIVIGIDPGFDRLGWAVGQVLRGNKINLLSFGLITTDKKQPLLQRYQDLDQQLTKVIEEFKPDEASLETLFFFKNQTTVMQVAETRGIIISALFRHQVKIAQYTPRQIKSAVAGDGAASKTGVEKMVRWQLNLPEDAQVIDDTYDALAALITHAGVCKVAKMQSKSDSLISRN